MTDFESSKSNDKTLQECSLSDENESNGGNNDGEDVESGIGTFNEYDIVINVEGTEVGSNSNETDHVEDFSIGSVMERNSSRRHTEGDVRSQSSERNTGLRRHTIAVSRQSNVDDYQPETHALRLSSKEIKPGKGSMNFEPRRSRRHTEGDDVLSQSSERNTGRRRHTFAASRQSNVNEDDYQPETHVSGLSSKEIKPGKGSMSIEPKRSRRHTEGDVLSQSSERNTDRRRHTFAASKQSNVNEDDYQPETHVSGLSSKEIKRGKGSINSPKGSRRHTESDVLNKQRNTGHRRYTFAGSRLDNIQEDDFQASNNTSILSKSFSDTGINVARDFSEADNSFRLQNYNRSRRNTIAGDIVEGLRELLEKSVEEDNDNTSRLPNKGERHTIANINVSGNRDVPWKDDSRDPEPEAWDDDDISTSEDEQNLRRTREQYESFKRHTIPGDGSEYNQDRIQSRGWFTSDKLDRRINPDNRQLNTPKSAVLKRHTIAGTTRQDMDSFIEGNKLRSLRHLARSSQGRKYSEPTSTIHRRSVNETQEDGLPDNIPTPLKRHSASEQEYIRDVIMDKDEAIRIDRLPRGSSLSRRHTVHSGRQDGGAAAVYPEPQTKRRATHIGFTRDRESTLHTGLKNEHSCSRRASGPVERRKIESDLGHGVHELPDEEQQDDNVDLVDTTIHPVYGHSFENHDILNADEDGLDQNIEVIEDQRGRNENCNIYLGEDGKYYVYNDHETDQYYVPRTQRNSSRYFLSNNEPHIHEEDAPRGTNIIVEDTNLTNSMKIHTPRFTITQSGQDEIRHHGQKIQVYHANDMDQTHGETRVQHEEVITSQQSKDLNTGTVLSNYFVLGRSVAPSHERRMNETGLQSGVLMIPARNILLRGQDEKGNKLKFNLSVIEEEGDDDYRSEMELHSQETSDKRVSAQQFVYICSQKPVAQNNGHLHDAGGKREGVDSNHENNPCQRSCSNTEKTQQIENDNCSEISEKTDPLRADERRAVKSTKLHRKESDNRSQEADDKLSLPCCSLHSKYQLHHPICCWHMTNNKCDNCKAKQRRERDTAESCDFSRKTSQTNENLAEETGPPTFSNPAQETKCISKSEQQKACSKCGGDLEIETGSKKETKPENSENFQSVLDDSRPNRDTSSERGEYKTAQETSISEDDFNDIKLYSDEDSSSVHRKKRRHRKSYKSKWRRKGSLERRRGSPIRLSPIKTAAYDRMVKQNKEMSDYLAKLTDEKSELRSTLCHLELQISQYRDREANHLEGMRRNKNEMEAILTTERTRAAQDCRTLHETVEGQKRKLNELQDKLREKEIEVEETKHSLQIMEDQLEIYKTSAKRLQSSESFVPHWTPTRIQKLYSRYIRAEKSRKSLIYQKKYLVLLLGGFRENETRTLALIAKMGAYPSYHEPTSRFSPAFTRFRTAVRVVVATKRMQFLVAKSKKSIRQVMEPVDSKSSSQRNTPSSSKSANNNRQYDLSRPSNAYQSVRSRFEADDVNGYSLQPSDISTDPKDASFAEIYSGSIDTAVQKHTYDSGVYSAFDYKPTEMVARRGQPNSGLTNRLGSHNVHSMSPPVRERPNSHGSRHSSIHPPLSTYQADPRRNIRTALHFDSEDLDRKIQTLDNLQQKLSLNRGQGDNPFYDNPFPESKVRKTEIVNSTLF